MSTPDKDGTGNGPDHRRRPRDPQRPGSDHGIRRVDRAGDRPRPRAGGRPGRGRRGNPLDVTDPASIARLGAALAGRPLDVLVNNAGTLGPSRQSSLDMDFEGFAHSLRVNTLGPLRVAQGFLANLRAPTARLVVSILMDHSPRLGCTHTTGRFHDYLGNTLNW